MYQKNSNKIEEKAMSDEAFTEEDTEHPRLDRFKARREMINTMITMGVQSKPIQLDTPKGAVNASKLKEMYKDQNTEEGQKFVQIGLAIHRPPGAGSIAKLVEEARARGLVKEDEAKEFQVTGTPKHDYFCESGMPKFARHKDLPKKETKK